MLYEILFLHVSLHTERISFLELSTLNMFLRGPPTVNLTGPE